MNTSAFEGASFGGGGRLCNFHSRNAASWTRPHSQRTDCVLAPIEAPSRVTIISKPSVTEPASGNKNRLQDGVSRTVSSGKALVGQLWGIWQRDSAAPLAPIRQNERDLQKLGEAATERGLQVDTAVKRREAVKAPPADIGRYLKATGLMETRYIRMLSSLCAETYYLNKLNKRTLYLRHRLHLVTTSHECSHVAKEVPRSAQQTMDEGDAMAASPSQAEAVQQDLMASSQRSVPAMEALEKLKAADAKKEKALSPTEVVAQRLSMAAAAAANAASSAAGPLANNITSFTSAASSAAAVQAVTSQLQVAAAAGHSTAVATIATVTAAVQATWGSDKDKLGNPTEWYVADDNVSHTRYFVIQGSDSIDHWKVNLTFDPVIFEDPSLGVKVHRGVYDAAKRLYKRFKPMLEEHLASSPFAKVAFVGHSLGGSLGSLLMLMFLHRGVLPHSAVSPTYTFGAPAIFCEACGPGGTCALNTGPPLAQPNQRASASASSECDDGTCLHMGHATAEQRALLDSPEVASRSLLERMGLPTGAIRNIIMHRDIVPRAFACDYSLVADLLARVGDGFREHGCLQNPHGRQVMYYFLGKMLVLQPDQDHTFVKGEPDHPMLPMGPGLYTLREPSLLSTVASGARAKATKLGSEGAAQAAKVAKSAASLARMGRRGATHLGNIAPKPASVGKAKLGGLVALAGKAERKIAESQAPQLGPPAPTLFDAVMELLDCPHPLDTLSEVTAYGPDGAISRFHNPDNYTRALGGVLRSRARSWRPLLGDAKNSSSGNAKKAGKSQGDAEEFRVGQGPAPTGGLWFLPPKGTTKVQVHPKKASGGAERRQVSDAVLAKNTTGSCHS
ncbi:probable phospholipase A1 PLIP3, chloroplastic [Coccomyxa sp. Obi]|nr:probable phospholipase A1 PLIP3, chloroplastic [Coccomyxa sp. Obi]